MKMIDSGKSGLLLPRACPFMTVATVVFPIVVEGTSVIRVVFLPAPSVLTTVEAIDVITVVGMSVETVISTGMYPVADPETSVGTYAPVLVAAGGSVVGT